MRKPPSPRRSADDRLFRLGTGFFALLVVLLVGGIAFELYENSRLSIQKFGFHFWQTTTWDPVAGDFGALPYIWGTLYSSLLALVISTPIALGIAIFLSELSPRFLRTPLAFLTELLAAIPSIVYGLWGIFVLVPIVRQIEVHTPDWLKKAPLFTGPPLGVGMLAAGLILAVMVIPFTSSVAREVLKAVPATQREAAYALGATRWEAIRAHRDRRRHHARLRARDRRDDGGHDGDREQPANQFLTVCRAAHDGRGDRERVHGSRHGPLPERVDRDRPRALRHHPGHQRALAAVDLERQPRGQGRGRDEGRRDGAAQGRRVNQLARRKLLSGFVVGLCALAVVAALIPLALIFFYVVEQGFSSLNWDFFTKMPKPVGETGGGMANAILGTLMLMAIASVLAIPVGLIAGVYLSEYGRTAFATLVRFTADVLNGIPSIVIGIFAYGLAVLPVHRFSALAGGLALGFMMLPIVARTTEELLNLVPASLREGSLALGATRAQAAFGVMVPAALPGIMTGILLAIARIAGETAPLLFTSFNNRFFTTRLDQPIASLTVQVFTYAISPYEDWHRQAWAGALVLVIVVFVFSVLARVVTRRLERMHRT